MKTLVPSLFVSHGLPPMALMDDPYNSRIVNFGRNIEIKGIVCVSSHWISPGAIQITASPKPSIQYNFQGYQKEIYDLKYQTPYSSELVQQVANLLDEEGFEIALNPHYGFDYGVWMPLRLIRPEADLPVVQISLPLFEDPRKIMQIGHTLSALREHGILLMGSGVAAFNPTKLIWHARGEEVNKKIEEFDNWLESNIMTAQIEDILDYRKIAPHGEFAHPSSATLLPLFFTIGTSMHGDRPQILYKGFKYSTTSLFSFCLSSAEITNKSFS
jgi:4,5-DOPA dioxygenase extradiol